MTANAEEKGTEHAGSKRHWRTEWIMQTATAEGMGRRMPTTNAEGKEQTMAMPMVNAEGQGQSMLATNAEGKGEDL